jgi:adenylate cyclase
VPELTDVRDNTEIWGQHYSGRSTQIIALQQQIAGDLGEKLRSKLSTSEKQQVTKQGTQNPEAYELYLKGRYYLNKLDVATAISYFNQAIAKDPTYALPYSGLADAYNASSYSAPSEVYPKSTAAASKALELDPSLAHPHAVLGSNKMEYEWDFPTGEAEYKKALELDPSDATMHQYYAFDIGMIGGREQEAIAEMIRAHQLDPLSPVIGTGVGHVYGLARKYDEAIAACEKVLNDNPTFAPHSGDYVLADPDGIVIIPQALVEEVTVEAEEVLRKENLVRKAILQGVDPVAAYLQYGKF